MFVLDAVDGYDPLEYPIKSPNEEEFETTNWGVVAVEGVSERKQRSE